MYSKKEKEKKIKAEKNRLNLIYKEMSDDKKRLVIGLVQRQAYLRISLDELENDLNENGYTEPFSQGNQEPYDRKRPNADIYTSMIANYMKIVKQLSDLLPKDEVKQVSDGFDDFVNGRAEI